MQKVTFIKKCLFGAKGEERSVTDRAALQYEALGLIEKLPIDVKEEKSKPETKEEKQVIETKESKPKKIKITKAPRL
jgi:uncharacterized protein with von Willebrand factor type A (vWA) domain